MKVKPLKIKIKEPTPSAADRLYAKHQAIRKQRGLPDPSEYKKKLDSMKNEETEQLDEISRDTLLSYANKVSMDSQKHSKDPTRRSAEKANRSVAGYAKAHNRLEKSVKEEVEELEEKKNLPGLWANIRAKRARGERPAKPGEKGYPKTLNIEAANPAQQAAIAINMKKKGIKPKNEEVEYLEEKNAPTNPSLWSKAKSLARSKFDVYPSAYANGWAAKWYKSKGGGWKSVSESTEDSIESHATLSRKAQIVRDASKSKKDKQNAKDEASDKFQSEPELSSAIHKT